MYLTAAKRVEEKKNEINGAGFCGTAFYGYEILFIYSYYIPEHLPQTL